MGRLIKTKDYIYDENGFMIFTEHYLKKRKFCCGSHCLNCPYTPKYRKGVTNIKK